MKILIIAPAWVGDMIMAQVLFKVLAQQPASPELTVVAPNLTAALAMRMAEISDVATLDVGHGQLGLKTRYQLAKGLRSEHYDQAIVLPNSWKSALVPFWAKIPKRTGWLGESRYWVLNDWRRLDKVAYPLMIQRFAALALPVAVSLPEPLPYPSLQVDQVNQQQLLQTLNLNTQKPILILCPGAEFGPAKRWPPAHFAAVAEHYVTQGGQAWILGSPKEQPAADALLAAVAKKYRAFVMNLAGRTQLLEAVDLMALADHVVTNDSGLMHLAAAVGRRVIAVFGSTSPDFTPPLSALSQVVNTDIACRPCFQRICPLEHRQCLTQLRPEQVIARFTDH